MEETNKEAEHKDFSGIADLQEDNSVSKCGNFFVRHFLFDLPLNLFKLLSIWLQSAPASCSLSLS